MQTGEYQEMGFRMNRGLFQILGSVWLCSFAAGQLPPPPTQADYIDYVKARTHFRLWRDGKITDFQITGWLKEGLSSAEVEKVLEIVKSSKVGDRVQETLWNSLSIGCQLSVSTNCRSWQLRPILHFSISGGWNHSCRDYSCWLVHDYCTRWRPHQHRHCPNSYGLRTGLRGSDFGCD